MGDVKPRRTGRVHFWVRVIFPLGALCLALGGTHVGRRRAAERRAVLTQPLTRRGLELCAAFAGPCELAGDPGRWGGHRDVTGPRSLWVVPCRAGGRWFQMVFNARAGRLAYVLGESRSRRTRWQPPNVAPIASPGQAAAVAVQRLRELGVVDPEASVALVGEPSAVRSGEAWQVNWAVRPPAGGPAFRIKMTLDRLGGAPLMLVDSRYATHPHRRG